MWRSVPNVVDMVVFSHGLYLMISEVFSNLIDSVIWWDQESMQEQPQVDIMGTCRAATLV